MILLFQIEVKRELIQKYDSLQVGKKKKCLRCKCDPSDPASVNETCEDCKYIEISFTM